MKFKYFLRGLGVGIVFASIIFLAAYDNPSTDKISDEQIIKRAKELGMVETDGTVGELLKEKNSSEKKTVSTEEALQEKTTEAVTEKKKNKKDSNKKEITTTEDQSTENNTSEDGKKQEATTEGSTEEKKENKKTESDKKKDSDTAKQNDNKKEDDTQTIKITIERGTSSYPVCQKLEELGLIDNAAKFDDYLVENGYANRLCVGTHKLKKGMDYKTIAIAISDPI